MVVCVGHLLHLWVLGPPWAWPGWEAAKQVVVAPAGGRLDLRADDPVVRGGGLAQLAGGERLAGVGHGQLPRHMARPQGPQLWL